MKTLLNLLSTCILLLTFSLSAQEKVIKTDAEWKQILTPKQYYVLRQKGTERAFTGELNKNHQKGTYHCAGCKTLLFKSKTKFNSGTGWPSFYDHIGNHVDFITDNSHGMQRTEITCSVCNGHLGHVFNDGPRATGKRYCVNSASLIFKKKE